MICTSFFKSNLIFFFCNVERWYLYSIYQFANFRVVLWGKITKSTDLPMLEIRISDIGNSTEIVVCGYKHMTCLVVTCWIWNRGTRSLWEWWSSSAISQPPRCKCCTMVMSWMRTLTMNFNHQSSLIDPVSHSLCLWRPCDLRKPEWISQFW